MEPDKYKKKLPSVVFLVAEVRINAKQKKSTAKISLIFIVVDLIFKILYRFS